MPGGGEVTAEEILDAPIEVDAGALPVEFYADWCEACQAMAPAMETIAQQHRDQLDVVLLKDGRELARNTVALGDAASFQLP